MELKFYRHKEYKDLYLVRTNVCGGNENSSFYGTTSNVLDAIRSLEYHGDNFLDWYKRFPNNKTETVLVKEMELDGYKGTLKKTVCLPIKEFELVTLREVEE